MSAIRYAFVGTGADAVANQILSIESAFKRQAKAANEAGAATDKAVQKRGGGAGAGAGAGPLGGGRGGSSGGGLSSPEKLGLRVAADQERAAKRAADAQVRESKRVAAEQGKAAQYVAKIRDKHFADEQKSGERAAKRTADAQARESKRSAAEQAKSAAYVARVKDRHFAAEQKATERTEATEARVAAKAAKAADKKSDGRWADAGGIAKGIGGAALGAGAASLGIVGQAAREAISLRDAANRISIGARGAGEKGVDPGVLAREFQQAALASPGVKATDVAEGTASFVAKTGDLAAARRFQSTFATTASATGSSVQDIAGAASDIFQKFDITSIDDMRSALAALTFQGKSGAFELKDAASQFAKMSSAASRFGLSKGPEGLKTLGGLSQIAMSSTGSPEKTASAVSAMFRQLVMNATKLQGQGVQVFEKGSHNTKTRNVQDILVETISKNKGSLPKLQNIFGDEGISAVSPLISKYNEAANATKGTEAEKTAAGVRALREALAAAIDAPGDWSEVVKDAAQAQTSSGAQLDAAWEQIKAKVSDEAVPALTQLIPVLSQLAAEGIDPAITTFRAIAEAGLLVVDLFKFLGLIHPKVLTAAEQNKKAKGELEEFDKKHKGFSGPLTAADTAEKARLEKNVADTDAAMWTKPVEVGKGKPRQQLDSEEFAKRYAAAATDYNPGATPEQAAKSKASEEAAAKALAQRLITDPKAYDEHENTAQRKLREDYAGGKATSEGQGNVGAPQDGAGGADGGAALKDAATALKDAATKLGNANKAPSIVDGAQIP